MSDKRTQSLQSWPSLRQHSKPPEKGRPCGDKQQHIEVKRLHKEKLTPQQIADRLGVNMAWVCHAINTP